MTAREGDDDSTVAMHVEARRKAEVGRSDQRVLVDFEFGRQAPEDFPIWVPGGVAPVQLG